MLLLATPLARADYRPNVAIVLCEDTYEREWFTSHGSSQGLVGLAGLIGIPYHTLTLTELLEDSESDYTSLWFSACAFVGTERIGPLAARLQEHLLRGGSVFLDGPLGMFSRDVSGTETYQGMKNGFPFLGIKDNGWYPLIGYSIHTTESEHLVAERGGHPSGNALTQGIARGVETLALVDDSAPGSEVLLEFVSPMGTDSYPYLVVTEPGNGAKVMAVGSYGTDPGPATPFRNALSDGFFDNQLLPYMVQALLWLVGPEDEPFAGLQLSHAPMTAIARLDGDWSQVPTATQATLDYVIQMGQRTGVATVYGIVSSPAQGADWQGFQAKGRMLQELGGSIGSHSRTHDSDMSDNLDEASWAAEVAGSLQEIRAALTTEAFRPDAYTFINPGDAIESGDYGKFFADIELFMTHGFETMVPYSSGVMGFGLPAGVPARPVINNTPAPDFQWFYLQEWKYTVAQAADIQSKLLGYYQNTVGRGVLYNQMWHDYAISDLAIPVNYPDEPTTGPLFDANGEHFARHRIYAPSVRELVDKMHIAHDVGLASTMRGNRLRVTLDYTKVPAERREHVAGMGVRVNASSQPIRAVTIDGQPHLAFTEHTVILPGTVAEQQVVEIDFGPTPESPIRLTHISKPFARIEQRGDGMEVWMRHPGLATSFCVAGGQIPLVLLHADSFHRTASGELCGWLAYESPAPSFVSQLLDTGAYDVRIQGADRPLTAATWNGQALALEVGAGASGYIDIAAAQAPERILVDGHAIANGFADGRVRIDVPLSDRAVMITLEMPYQPPAVTDPPDDPGAGESSGCGCTVGTPSTKGRYGMAVLLMVVAAWLGLLRWPLRILARRR